MFLYPWLGAHLALGYLGYKAYDNNINGNADYLYEITVAIFKDMGMDVDREAFDEEYFSEELYDQSNVKGFSRSRLAGFVSAGLSLAGTAATFLAPANIFQYLTFGTTLTSAFVLVQALLANGWYDDIVDPSDTTLDTAAEVDPYFEDSRNYLLYGGIAAFATDALVLTMMFLAAPTDVPVPEDLPAAEAEDATVELSVW
jgi:hypothetical protein